MFPSPCFRIEEVLVSPLTFAGVGKTVLAALDYKRFIKANSWTRLLFVAHRKEILEQSIQTFQEILNDFNFGELYVDGRKPTDIEHLLSASSPSILQNWASGRHRITMITSVWMNSTMLPPTLIRNCFPITSRRFCLD